MDDVIDTTELRRVVGGNIAQLRQANGFSQKELADKLGVAREHVSRIENGHMLPSAEVLFAAADTLQVPVDFFRKIPVHAA